VHKSADGKLAVVAVRLTEDPASPTPRWPPSGQHLPRKPPAPAKRLTEMVNPGGLLPADRGYWTYTGSLTTPPCTEGVRWFVFEQELSLEPRPVARLRGALPDEYPRPAGPAQAAHRGQRIGAARQSFQQIFRAMNELFSANSAGRRTAVGEKCQSPVHSPHARSRGAFLAQRQEDPIRSALLAGGHASPTWWPPSWPVCAPTRWP
jgi:hypothetical protein